MPAFRFAKIEGRGRLTVDAKAPRRPQQGS
jgi:hypothetical protein